MRPSASLWLPGSCLFLACALAAQTSTPFDQAQGRPPAPGVWTYGGTPAQTRHSRLAQINRANVKQLEVAWTYDTGEPGWTQTQPLVVGDVLYGYTTSHKLFAIDAATGVPKWVFDSGVRGSGANRGVMYWADGAERRVFAAVGNFVYAVDVATGKAIETFGTAGRIDLRENLGRDPQTQGVRLTTPGVIYKDLMILGGRVGEGLPTSPGDVRAYDVRTGALRWSFHTIPHPGEFGYSTWPKEAWEYSGGANSWPGMALDEPRGLVYVPTGSAASDFYGADRPGDNLFGNSLIALDAATGKRMWHFQVVRHDVWDRDLPSPPTLVTIRRGGRTIDAVAQATKHGFLFVFDRVSGEPVFPIEYKEFPASTLTGEITSKTQPIPSKPAPFSRQLLTADLLSNRTPAVHQAALEQFKAFRSEGQFVPFGVDKPTVVFPGFDGGAEWGGQAFDPDTGLYYVNANDLAWTGALEANAGGRFVGPASGGAHPLINNAFRFTGYKKFLDADGYPAVAPPWGTLNAINLNTGEYAWKIPLGEYPELVQQGLANTGSENYGGPIVTAGGLVFIAATNHDRKIRAFDKATGALLWEATMPSSGNATPATYEVNGRQYLVVAAGGGKSRTGGPGGKYVAFALPR
jgi:glucose dehydrogenase